MALQTSPQPESQHDSDFSTFPSKWPCGLYDLKISFFLWCKLGDSCSPMCFWLSRECPLGQITAASDQKSPLTRFIFYFQIQVEGMSSWASHCQNYPVICISTLITYRRPLLVHSCHSFQTLLLLVINIINVKHFHNQTSHSANPLYTCDVSVFGKP